MRVPNQTTGIKRDSFVQILDTGIVTTQFTVESRISQEVFNQNSTSNLQPELMFTDTTQASAVECHIERHNGRNIRVCGGTGFIGWLVGPTCSSGGRIVDCP